MRTFCGIYFILINLISFVMYCIDKKRAKNHKWRISENALILSCVFGGSIGGLLGMKIFHHKTKHKKFTIGVPVILILQIILFCMISGGFRPLL